MKPVLITLKFIIPEESVCPECSRQLKVNPENLIEAYLEIECDGCGENLTLTSTEIDCSVQ